MPGSLPPVRSKRRVRRRAGRPPASRPALGSKDEILLAALRAFGESGYQEMSVRKLAQSLGVSHNLIAHYYQSKEALWRACVDLSVGAINADLMKLAADAPPDADILDVMRAIMERFVHLAAKYPANLFIITQEGASGGRRLDYLYETLMAPAQQALNSLVERAWTEGRVRKIDLRTLFFLVTHGGASIFSMVPLAQKMGGPHPLDEDFIAAQARIVADILLRGIMIDPPPLHEADHAVVR